MDNTNDSESRLLGSIAPQNIQEKKKKSKKQNSFDWLLLKRFISVSRILYLSGWTIVVSLVLFALSLVQIFVVSQTGDVVGGFYQAIVDKDTQGFKDILIKASFVIVGSAILDSTIKFLAEILAWRWRRTLCLHLHDKYFFNLLYYKIVSFDHRIDNPDQRITQDVDNFCTTLSQVLLSCFGAPFNIGFYTIQTWLLIGWYAPLIISGFFLIGYLINKLIMSPIVKLVFRQEKLEGDFRFAHIRVRTWAESIALYDGGGAERLDTERTFQELLRNKIRIVIRQWSLNTSSNAFAYLGSILNYVVVALPVLFIPSQIESTPLYVGKATFNCISLIYGYSMFINASKSISDLAGYTSRIADMLETLQELKDMKYSPTGEGLNTETSCKIGTVAIGEYIQFENVTCYTPTGIQLATKLNFKVEPGTNMLIMGPTGSGKSSILRVMNGLWPFYEGNITKPSLHISNMSMFYLPQKPYLFHGTLKHQIIYPKQENEASDTITQELLNAVGLDYLFELYNLENELYWPDVLSLGEQQLISFARLFFHKPTFAILDEATSSLHEEVESLLYETCFKNQITVISVGHRASLRKFHDCLLLLDKNHNWTLSDISSSL